MRRLLSPEQPRQQQQQPPTELTFKFPERHNAYSRSVQEDLQDPKKARAFEKLKASLSDVWLPEFEDDFLLFRWLKARQFDAKKAEQMLRAHLVWRKESGADRILDEFEMPESLTKYYTGGFCGHDNEGRPVWYDPVGLSDPEGLARSATREQLIRSRIFISEWTCKRLLPRRRQETGLAVYQLCVVYDLRDFSRKQMWPPSLELFLELTRICEANYPETMGAAFVINAPPLFPALYSLIKPLLHKETQSKIHILGEDYEQVLLSHIPCDQLPASYGGSRCDPDRQCSRWICYGGSVPQDFWLRPTRPTQEVQIGRRAALKVELRIEAASDATGIEWEFVTEEGDIAFEIYRLLPDQSKRHLQQQQRIDSDVRPASGWTSCCGQAGIFVAKFDNSYSWTKGKRLHYHLSVRDGPPSPVPLIRGSLPRFVIESEADATMSDSRESLNSATSLLSFHTACSHVSDADNN